jgi:hypothetical protein
MSLGHGGRVAGAPNVEVGRRYAGRRVADAPARALWRPRAQVPLQLPGFKMPNLLKVELYSKTYE